MKKGWKKIGKVKRPERSLVFVDKKGNVMAMAIPKKKKPAVPKRK